MFPMLDYRAHKLYNLIAFFPVTLLNILTFILIPFAVYFIGYSNSDDQIIQIIFCVIALIVIEIVWAIIIFLVSKSIKAVFNTFVDVVPHDGRTKEQAELVVEGGENAVWLINFDLFNPRDWTDDKIEEFINRTAFSARTFFSERIRKRLWTIRKHYIANPESEFNMTYMQLELKKLGVHVKWDEQLFSSFYGFRIVIVYGSMLYLILFNPFSL